MGSEQESEELELLVSSSEKEYKVTNEFMAHDLRKSDTPNTNLPDVASTPDISLLCEQCEIFINLSCLSDHRNFHKCLTILKYFKGDQPKKLDALLRRRNAVIRRIKSKITKDQLLDPKQIQDVNDAYEYLKSELDGSFGQFRQLKQENHSEVRGKALNCSAKCVSAVGICSNRNDRWKNYMEDTYSFQDSFGEDPGKCYFGVFDGHHGEFAAEVGSNELHHILSHEIAKFDSETKVTIGHQTPHLGTSRYNNEPPKPSKDKTSDDNATVIEQIIKMCEEKFDDMHLKNQISTTRSSSRTSSKKKKQKSPFTHSLEEALTKVYYLVDILLSYGKDECSKVRWSGCSACNILMVDTRQPIIMEETPELEGDDNEKEDGSNSQGPDPPKEQAMLYLANAGDVKAVLVRGNKPYLLTKDHSPLNIKERERVLKNGGDISDSSKSMLVNGILSATRGLGNHGDKKLKQCIAVEPHTMAVEVDQYAQFVVIATKGIWEVFSEKEVSTLLLEMLPCNYIPGPSRLSSSLKMLLEEAQQIQREASEESKSTGRKVSFTRFKNGRNGNTSNLTKPGSAASILAPSTLSEGHKRDGDLEKDESFPQLDHFEGDDSGNEGDIDTDNEMMSLPSYSRLSINSSANLCHNAVQRELAKAMAEYLTQAALLAGAKDNITVTIILLPGSGI